MTGRDTKSHHRSLFFSFAAAVLFSALAAQPLYAQGGRQSPIRTRDMADRERQARSIELDANRNRTPKDVLAAMEKQMRAEREKRAVILTSEGQRDAAINTAEGEKQQVIKASEASRQRRINEAEGQAAAIREVASATAQGLREVATAIRTDGGMEAVQLRVAEQYVTQFGQIARQTNTVVVPANVSDVAGMIAAAMKVFDTARGNSRSSG